MVGTDTGARAQDGDRVGVLFDVDGTLIDSTYLHTVSWWHAFRRAGLDVGMWRLHWAIGMGADQLIPHVLAAAGSSATPAVDSVADTHDAIYSTFWPTLRPLPGARELVIRSHEAGW